MTDSSSGPPPDDQDPTREPDSTPESALGGESALTPPPPDDENSETSSAASSDEGPGDRPSDDGAQLPPTGGDYPPPPPGGQYPPPPPGGQYPPPPPGGQYPPPPPGGQYPPPPPGDSAYPPPPPGAYPPGAYPPGSYPPGAYPPVDDGAPRASFMPTDAIAYGWRGFTANLGPLIIIGLVLILVSIASNFLTVGFDSWLLNLAANVLAIFLSFLISLGLIRAALMILDGARPSVEQLVSTKDIGPYIVASLLVSLIVAVGLLLCIIPGLVAAFFLQFFGYAIVDGRTGSATGSPQSDPIGALRTSYEVVSANLGSLFLLALLSFVVNVAGALLCGVGLLVTLPVTSIALAYAWRYFTGGRIAAQA